MLRAHLLLVMLAACGGQAKTVTLPSAGGTASPDLHVGDVIVYAFSGSFSHEPVRVREEVVALDGARATIDVRATRGREERHWIQVGPADADARWSNKVDEIDIVTNETKQRLANPDDATLARLWEWVIVPADGAASKAESAPCDQKIGAATLACTCERATIGPMQTEQSRCPFAWQRGPAHWTKNGDVVWRADVVESSVKAP